MAPPPPGPPPFSPPPLSRIFSITTTPHISRWASLLPAGWTRSEEQRRFRMQMGLATDRPVALGGHQCALWHMGIAAKWLALRQIARESGWASGWLLVDQDPEDFAGLAYPRQDVGERLWKRATAEVAPRATADEVRAGVPPCLIPAFDAPGPPDDPALSPWRERLIEAASALNAAKQAGASRAATQVGEATAGLFCSWLGQSAAHEQLLTATSIHRTDLFNRVLREMTETQAHAFRCAEAYNQAIATVPHAQLKPLVCEPANGRIELPLWQLDPATGIRKRVFLHHMKDLWAGVLAPRALLLTGLLRAYGCDLFVHGTGGGATESGGQTSATGEQAAGGGGDGHRGASASHGGYDAATERWLGEWLGLKLAPSVVATATVHLTLEGATAVTREEAARAAWRSHRAAHDPALLGDVASAARRGDLLEAIRRSPRGPARMEAYRAMHRELEAYRRANTAGLERLRHEGHRLNAEASAAGALTDRTYSFVLHGPEGLRALEAALREHAMGEGKPKAS